MIGTTEKNVRKYNAIARTIEIKFIEKEMNPELYIKTVIEQIIDDVVKANSALVDQIGITITNNKEDRPIYVSFRPSQQITSQVILNEFEKVLQSNAAFTSDEPLKMFVTKVKMPQGRGRDINEFLSLPFDAFCKRKTSFITIKNKDNLCLPRALVVGQALLDKRQDQSFFKSITRKDQDTLKAKAVQLCRDAGVTIGENGSDITTIQKFQNHLNDYKITIFDGSEEGDRRGRKVIFEGKNDSEKYIDLIYGNNHFNVITSLTGAFSYSYFCRKCKVGYDHRQKHNCTDNELCPKCFTNPPCFQTGEIECENCKRQFYGPTCYEKHLKPNSHFDRNKATCEVLKFCRSCKKEYSPSTLKGKQHKCGYHICHNCNKYVEYDHLCYIQPIRKTKDAKKEKAIFVFFDFECRVEDEPATSNAQNSSFRHIPNFCVMQQQCYKCLENENIEENCEECGVRETIISDAEGDDLLKTFFSALINIGRNFQKVYIFAHNGGGYDYQFLAEYMIRTEGWKPGLILNGSKIIQMTFGKWIFKDSLNFLHARLADLPKMFGIENKVKG